MCEGDTDREKTTQKGKERKIKIEKDWWRLGIKDLEREAEKE